jgi:hypothetical protein
MNTSAPTLQAILTSIAEGNGGTLTPSLVLSHASDPASPIHHHFQWDDGVAAHNWRLEQAAQLIRRVRITLDGSEDRTYRAFVSITPESVDDGERPAGIYVALETAISVPNYREQLLAAARRDAMTFASKYAALQEIKPLINAMKEIATPTKGERKKSKASKQQATKHP